MKYSVYTFIFGKDYEKLREIAHPDPEAEYICITDNENLHSDTWQIICTDLGIPDAEYTGTNTAIRRSYRARWTWYKYTHNDIVVIMDGSVTIANDLQPLIHRISTYDAMILTHLSRNTIAQEYKAWISLRNLDEKYMHIFADAVKPFDIYTDKGLFATTTMIMNRNQQCIDLSNSVMQALKTISNDEDRVDQIYLSYLLNTKFFNTLDICFTTFDYLYRTYFNVYAHNSDIIYNQFDCYDNKYQNNKIIHLNTDL